MSREQTRQAIMSAFIDLLNRYPMERISVKDVVAACAISRNTFYYHYRDIYALLADVFEQEAMRVIGVNREGQRWQDAFIASTRFALENRRAIYHVYNSVNRDTLERYLFRISEDVVEQVVRGHAEGLNVDDSDIRFITIFYKHAIVGIIEEWLQNDMRNDPVASIRRLGDIFDGNIRTCLEKVSK